VLAAFVVAATLIGAIAGVVTVTRGVVAGVVTSYVVIVALVICDDLASKGRVEGPHGFVVDLVAALVLTVLTLASSLAAVACTRWSRARETRLVVAAVAGGGALVGLALAAGWAIRRFMV
jgi:hypothetical protein